MAEENEQGQIVSFVAEQFRRLNVRLDTMQEWIDERFDRLEERVAQVKRRLTASTYLEQGLVAHMASPHQSMDEFGATTTVFDRRLAAVEISDAR